MSEPIIHWRAKRMDEGEEPDLREAECVVEIEGRIECDGQPAGLIHAHYIYAQQPASDDSLMWLWDVDESLCGVYEDIIDAHNDEPNNQFREPIPRYLDPASGILCVHHIALRPEFRGMGMGRAVMRKLVHDMADARTGLVLLDTTPLQHLPRGYDDFDEEVRELPWNSPEEDQQSLIKHFGTWNMQHLTGTRFMMAAPETLRDSRAPQWPPCPVLDHSNTCVICGEWIDLDGDDWDIIADGSVHLACDGDGEDDVINSNDMDIDDKDLPDWAK